MGKNCTLKTLDIEIPWYRNSWNHWLKTAVSDLSVKLNSGNKVSYPN